MDNLTKQKNNAAPITSRTQEEPPAIIPENPEQAEQPYKIYDNNIYSLVDEFIEQNYSGLTDQELKQDKAFFPLLVDYLYDNYIGELLDNKYKKNTMYNIDIIDNLFNIYRKLVYLYKWNNKPYIVEFSLFTGINKNTFYNWLNGLEDRKGNLSHDAETTRQRSETVEKWFSACERALLDSNDTIKDIFILKAKHGYKDNNNDIQITVNHKAVIDADTLPDLIGINGKD